MVGVPRLQNSLPLCLTPIPFTSSPQKAQRFVRRVTFTPCPTVSPGREDELGRYELVQPLD